MRFAITRAISDAMSRCELTHRDREPIDLALARAQHHAYERVLGELGVAVIHLPQRPDGPDSVFVEDAAVAFAELAVMTRPGAASRRGEGEEIKAVLSRFRELRAIEAPGTIDGGDVLAVGRRVWIGLSSRTNASGAGQLAAMLSPHGYHVETAKVEGCLHLKSAATMLAPDRVLVDPRHIDPEVFRGLDLLETDPGEPLAANVLAIAGTVVVPASCPRTAEMIEAIGLTTVSLDCSEVAKAEGALTCCSILFDA